MWKAQSPWEKTVAHALQATLTPSCHRAQQPPSLPPAPCPCVLRGRAGAMQRGSRGQGCRSCRAWGQKKHSVW